MLVFGRIRHIYRHYKCDWCLFLITWVKLIILKFHVWTYRPVFLNPVMALNKSMHPRNRYKDKPPDFVYLASKYPDFQQHVHTSLTGRPVWVTCTVFSWSILTLIMETEASHTLTKYSTYRWKFWKPYSNPCIITKSIKGTSIHYVVNYIFQVLLLSMLHFTAMLNGRLIWPTLYVVGSLIYMNASYLITSFIIWA